MEQDCFTTQAAALSIFTAAAAEGLPDGIPLRLFLLKGLCSAVLLTVLSAFSVTFWQGREQNAFPAVAAKTALLFLLLAEWCATFARAQQVCRQEFGSMALVGLLPLLLWAGWKLSPARWNAPARVLWWFVVLGFLVLFAGLAGQMQWYRLWDPELQAPAEPWQVPLYGEYLLLPLLCPEAKLRRGVFLPFLGFGVQLALAAAMALVFGGGYPEGELLRAWSAGVFSRMDALLLWVWLTCAMFRMCFLCGCIRLLAGRILPMPSGSEVEP